MSSMEGIPKFELLETMYQALQKLFDERGAACEKGCAVCCTDRVCLTSLEAAYLERGLLAMGEERLLSRAMAQPVEEAARPAYGFNQLARLCMEQQEPPEQPQPERAPANCPLLQDGLCAAYEFRPLACRSMASRVRCELGGEAVGDDWWITIDAAFAQIVEHMSVPGYYGLLPEVLAAAQGNGEGLLLPCELLPGLPAAEEFLPRMEQTLGPLFNTMVKDKPLGAWMDLIRLECE